MNNNKKDHQLDLSSFRKEYGLKNLIEQVKIDKSWFTIFEQWFDEALSSQVLEPNAMVIASVNHQNKPYTRTVLAKEISENDLKFFTNYQSNKGVQFEANPNISATFLWLGIQKQVHIRGHVQKLSREESLNYWNLRPRGSQLGAMVSDQSRPIESRELLEQNYEKLDKAFPESAPIPLPDFWGGYDLVIEQVELWAGSPNRLHQRVLFTKSNKSWISQILQP